MTLNRFNKTSSSDLQTLPSNNPMLIDFNEIPERGLFRTGNEPLDYEEAFSSQPINKSKMSLQANGVKDKTVNKRINKFLRTHYSKKIVSALEWITENHIMNEPIAANHISILFNNIKDYSKSNIQIDPFCSFLLAIYDALAINNAWVSIDNETYNKISKYVIELNDKNVNNSIVAKYLLKLEKIGLEITPF